MSDLFVMAQHQLLAVVAFVKLANEVEQHVDVVDGDLQLLLTGHGEIGHAQQQERKGQSLRSRPHLKRGAILSLNLGLLMQLDTHCETTPQELTREPDRYC